MVTTIEGVVALSILLQLFGPIRWVKYVLIANLIVFGYLLAQVGPTLELLWLYGLLSAIGLVRVGIWLTLGLLHAGRRTLDNVLEQDDDWEELPPAVDTQADGGVANAAPARNQDQNQHRNDNPEAANNIPADENIPDNAVWPPEEAFDDVDLDLEGIDDHRQ